MKMRRCKYQNGCRELIPFGDSYCNAHKVLAESKASIKEEAQKRLESISQGYRASNRRTRYQNSERFDVIGGAFYKTYKWKRLAETIRVRDLYTCQVCNASGSICDHIVKRRLDESKAMDASNLWVLCRVCHNKKSALENRLPPEQQLAMNQKDWAKLIRES